MFQMIRHPVYLSSRILDGLLCPVGCDLRLAGGGLRSICRGLGLLSLQLCLLRFENRLPGLFFRSATPSESSRDCYRQAGREAQPA
jgi:hypothetical protein